MTYLAAVVSRPEDADAVADAGFDRIVFRLSENAGDALGHSIAATIRNRCAVTLWPASADPRLASLVQVSGADQIWGRVSAPLRGCTVWAVGDTDAGVGFDGIVIGGQQPDERLLYATGIGPFETRLTELRSRGLGIALAGSIEAPDVPRLLALEPDILVIEDGLRVGGRRDAPIDPVQLRVMRDLVPRHGAIAAERASSPRRTGVPDRIFVRDWTVPLRIGAYAYETAAQRVRFTVEVEVEAPASRAADMRDVVSYDLITDAISRATTGHVVLVETIAEHVASLILAHPRVLGVDVTVEKLDLGPGALGCRMVRRRD